MKRQEQMLDFSEYAWVCRFALETHTCHCNCQIKLFLKDLLFLCVCVREKEGGDAGGKEREMHGCLQRQKKALGT